MPKKTWFLWVILGIALFLAGCETGDGDISQPEQEPVVVGERLRELYDVLGGEQVLGQPISPMWEEDSLQRQYTEAALLVHDLAADAANRWQLGPIGREMGVEEPPVPAPSDSQAVYVAGHIIYPDFVPLYQKLMGERMVGRPLTEVHYNPEKKRYEQYFENLGFYRLENEPAGTAHLLAYGAWQCGADCRDTAPERSRVSLPGRVDSPFEGFTSQFGTDFTGFALTEPYTTRSGKLEQVFENVVLYSDPDAGGRIGLRPLPETLRILPGPLVTASLEAGMVFFPVEGEKGYNIPQFFLDYLSAHGGLELSGPPTGEIAKINGRKFQQCFTYLCMELDPDAPESVRVRPAHLGYTYRSLNYNPAAVAEQPSAKPQSKPAQGKVRVNVWEDEPRVNSNEDQQIRVQVLENSLPLAGAEPVLTLTLPDGNTQSYPLPPTGVDGRSEVRIPPIVAPNGTLIPYEVCVPRPEGEAVCVEENYVVLNNL